MKLKLQNVTLKVKKQNQRTVLPSKKKKLNPNSKTIK